MSSGERRKVGERGQVTLPKELRERFGIEGGDEVVIGERDGKIVIETPLTPEKLAEGYRRRAERDSTVAADMEGTSREADDELGDAPEW